MISGWNRFIYRNNVSNRMNMNINTGGYRSDKTYSSVYHALIVTNIRGYVYPVIYNVFFRQHRRMLYFFACLYKDAAVYDCWRWRGIPMKRQAVCAVCGQEFIADRVTQKYCSFLLPPLRPPARREQSCPFVAEKGSPAYLPLPEMRQAGAGDRADGPAHQVLFGSLRAPVLEALQESQLRRHPAGLPMPQLRNPGGNHGAEG